MQRLNDLVYSASTTFRHTSFDNEASSTALALLSLSGLRPSFWQMLWWDRCFQVCMKWFCSNIYLRAKHDACNCYRLISQVSSQVRLWPWIYHKNLNCRYWNEIMCATVVTFKTCPKHTVGGRKISLRRPDMHMPVIEVKLHNVTSYQKQRLFSFNCKCLQS